MILWARIYLSQELRLKPDWGQHMLNTSCSPRKPHGLIPSQKEPCPARGPFSSGSGTARFAGSCGVGMEAAAMVLGQPGSPPTAWTAVTEGCERRALSSILGWPLPGAGGCSLMAGEACFPRAGRGWREVLWGGKRVSSSYP